MRALRFALVSWPGLRVVCACAVELANAASVNIKTATKDCVLTLKPDSDRNINEGSCAYLLFETGVPYCLAPLGVAGVKRRSATARLPIRSEEHTSELQSPMYLV